jgi:hypothetical protein
VFWITVTPISRPFVKGAQHFFGSIGCQNDLTIICFQPLRSNRARFFG